MSENEPPENGGDDEVVMLRWSLALLLLFGVNGCIIGVERGPIEEVELPSDVPVLRGFALATADPVPRTSYEGKRFARYALVSNSQQDAAKLIDTLKSQLRAERWTLISEKPLEENEWHGRWKKDRDLLTTTLTQEEVEGDLKHNIESRLKVALNASD